MNISYVYLIGWKSLNVWYCGVNYSKNCHPSDLWTKYFTSSKHVKKFRQEHGEPDHIEILKEFDNSKDAREYEELKLKEFDVLNKDNWLNKSIAGKYFGGTGYFSESHRKKLSEARKRRIISEETKRKIGNAHKGKKISEEQKKQISETLKKFVITEETRIKISNANKGKIRSEESRKRYSAANKRRIYKPHSEETKQRIAESVKRTKALKKLINSNELELEQH